MVKDSLVAVTVRLTVVVIDEPVGVTVIVCAVLGRAIVAVVEIVTVTVFELVPSSVTPAGLKLHVAPAGSPLQLEGVKLTVGVAPPIGATVMTEVIDAPAATETVVGAADSENCGASAACHATAKLFTSTEPSPFTKL